MIILQEYRAKMWLALIRRARIVKIMDNEVDSDNDQGMCVG